MLARAICHELDHLDGHLYVEKAEGPLQDMTYEMRKKNKYSGKEISYADRIYGNPDFLVGALESFDRTGTWEITTVSDPARQGKGKKQGSYSFLP